jgi:hypothetical protein
MDGWEIGKVNQRVCVNKSLTNQEAAKLKQTGKASFVLITPVRNLQKSNEMRGSTL